MNTEVDTKFTTIELPTLHLFGTAANPTVDEDKRTVTVTASDETAVARFSWMQGYYMLRLSHTPKAVDLQRIKNGVCMFLEDHRASADYELGKVVSAKLENKQLRATIKLNDTEKAERYLSKALQGTEAGNSVGIDIYETKVIEKAQYEEDEDGYKRLTKPALIEATKWSLLELSSTTIPANPNAGMSADEIAAFEAAPKRSVILYGDTGYENVTESVADDLKVTFASAPVIAPSAPGKQEKTILFNSALEFPLEYSLNLKTSHPELWQLGQKRYDINAFYTRSSMRAYPTVAVLTKLAAKRQLVGEELFNSKELADVITCVQWGVVNCLGVDGMKQIIEQAKVSAKLTNKTKAKTMVNFETLNEDQLREQCYSLASEKESLQAQLATKDAEIAGLQNNLTQIENDKVTLKEYRGILAKAQSLLHETKLTKPEFDNLFSKTEDQFLASENTQTELLKLSAYLQAVEPRKAALNTTRTVTDEKPLERLDADESEPDDDIFADMIAKPKKTARSY